MNNTRYLIKWFVCAGIFCVSFFLLISMKLSNGNLDFSFFANVSEIAADDEYVYALDNRTTTLTAYTNNGDLVFRKNFSSTGANRIFFDSDGFICLFSVHEKTVRVYDREGTELHTYKASHAELVNTGILNEYAQEEVVVCSPHNIKYVFNNNLIADSTIDIFHNEITTPIVVESWESHILWYIIILNLALVVVYGAYNLICFIVYEYDIINKQKTV